MNFLESWFFLFNLFLVISSVTPSLLVSEQQKEKQRAFSIFSVVQFPNTECTLITDQTTRGTCLSSSDCSTNSGIADGFCASGFGVCCGYKISACGSTISRNVSYIQNPGYPSTFSSSATSTQSCAYTISTGSDICQLRLDFQPTVMANPTAATPFGSCTTDSLTFSSPTGRVTPTLCGLLTGQHIYIETGGVAASTSATFSFNLATTATRRYSIKVSQIECISLNKAPTDCLQYYLDDANTITSFNFNNGAGSTIRFLNYASCIRKNQGFCDVMFKQTPISSVNSFALLSAANQMSMNTGCTVYAVNIPAVTGTAGSDGFCGLYLNSVNGQNLGATVVSSGSNFIIYNESINADQTVSSIGYSVDYEQLPCVTSP